MLMNYDHLALRYEPFPIGLAKPVMDEASYRVLVDDYPPIDLFAYIPKIGKKYSLSEKYNPAKYNDFIQNQPRWKEWHRWVKSPEFIQGVLKTLKDHGVDLGLKANVTTARQLGKLARGLARGTLAVGQPRLSARFEFSMLPADGGSVIPHTDSPGKFITLVVSMMKPGEWNPAFGGGTDVNKPKDPRLYYNDLNRQAEFDEMEILETFGFEPNQAVIFVKTFNSWHSVRPMTGAGSTAMRKTLTINIEAAD
jgi:hypothetical protein